MMEIVEVGQAANTAIVEANVRHENLIENWVKYCDVSALTQRSYNAAAKSLLQFLSLNRLELSAESLIEYREWLKANRATTSARTYFSIAKIFVKWLAKTGVCRCDYSDGVKGVKLDISTHNRDSLTIDEAVAAIKSIKGDGLIERRNRAILAMLFCLGLRTIELARMDIGDIERRRGVWTVKIWGKARAGKVDSLILPPQVKKLLDEYLELRGKLSPSMPLFASTSRRNRNARLETQTFSRLAKRVFRQIGIDSARVTCHSARHSFATWNIEHGTSLDETSKALRHKSTAVTEVYRNDDKVFSNKATRTAADLFFSQYWKE